LAEEESNGLAEDFADALRLRLIERLF